jgi:hypothetical protein
MFSALLESGVDPDPEVRREATEAAARMVAAREEERKQIEEERLVALRELMDGYEVDDLTAEAGEPRASGKRGRKKAAGTGKPVFPQVRGGSQGAGENDGEFFRRSKRLVNRDIPVERATEHGHGELAEKAEGLGELVTQVFGEAPDT